MVFFTLLEFFFFLSLAITFVLIIMLVYHFKGRLVTLEEKYQSVYEIMTSMVKEMRTISGTVANISQSPSQIIRENIEPNNGLFPPELLRMFQSGPMFMSQRGSQFENFEEDDYDSDDETNVQKIVVSDNELDEDDEDGITEEDIKVISVNISEINNPISLDELDIDENIVEDLDLDEEEEYETPSIENLEEEQQNNIEENDKPDNKEEPIDYKKMDISYLRTLVINRGITTDTKKMKKNDLIKLLEQYQNSIESIE